MSNLTDFLDSMICALNEPSKSINGTIARFRIEDGIDQVDGKELAITGEKPNQDMTPEEKKIAKKEYMNKYIKEYKKTYVQPEHKKRHHNAKIRRKFGTALITSAKRRKEAKKLGLTIDSNGFIIRNKELKNETKNKVRKSNS